MPQKENKVERGCIWRTDMKNTRQEILLLAEFVMLNGQESLKMRIGSDLI